MSTASLPKNRIKTLALEVTLVHARAIANIFVFGLYLFKNGVK